MTWVTRGLIKVWEGGPFPEPEVKVLARYRSQAPRRGRPPALAPDSHGTEARARRHRRAGEMPCSLCLAAENRARRLRDQRSKVRAS